jgi:hypothetical protein
VRIPPEIRSTASFNVPAGSGSGLRKSAVGAAHKLRGFRIDATLQRASSQAAILIFRRGTFPYPSTPPCQAFLKFPEIPKSLRPSQNACLLTQESKEAMVEPGTS